MGCERGGTGEEVQSEVGGEAAEEYHNRTGDQPFAGESVSPEKRGRRSAEGVNLAKKQCSHGQGSSSNDCIYGSRA
jgi:hypothetical protein